MSKETVFNVGDKVKLKSLKGLDKVVDISIGDEFVVTEILPRSLVLTRSDGSSVIARRYNIALIDTDKESPADTTPKVVTKKEVTIEDYKIIGQKINKKMLTIAIEKNLPVLLVGETGTGKTSMVREQAIDQKKAWTRFNLTGETTVDEFVGKYELEGGKTVWRDGILLQAMKEGQWLVVDEINMALPEILTVLHSLLDDDRFIVVANHAGEVVKPHEDFRFFATMNPTEEYSGTKELNKAFQSRFSMILNVDYPTAKTEARIVQGKTGVPADIANKVADVASALRKAKKEDKIFYTCSTRDLLHWGNLIGELPMEDAFIVTILNKAPNDKETIVKIYDRVVGAYIKLEEQGYELSIDWFNKAAEKLSDERSAFESHKTTIRKEITEDIIRKLTKGGTVEAPDTHGSYVDTSMETVEVIEPEVKW